MALSHQLLVIKLKNMKIIIILFCFLSQIINAQSPVIPIETFNGNDIHNMYLKDVNNKLNPFVGTVVQQW